MITTRFHQQGHTAGGDSSPGLMSKVTENMCTGLMSGGVGVPLPCGLSRDVFDAAFCAAFNFNRVV